MGTNLGDLLAAAGLEASAAAAEAPDAPTDAPSAVEPRFATKVVVRRTRKGRGGRTVTLVQGVEAGHAEVAGLLKRKLGTGARVEGDDVVVQGDQVERVTAWLEARSDVATVRQG